MNMSSFICPLLVLYFLTYLDQAKAVLGGQEAKPDEYAFSVVLKRNGIYYCSGSIVSKTHVVTAAHCILNDADLNVEMTPIQVLIGSNDYTKSSGIIVDVDSVHIPKIYFKNLKSKINVGDIAVLKLMYHLDLGITNLHAKKLFLPEAISYKGKRTKFTGFGWNKLEKQIDTEQQKIFWYGGSLGQLRAVEVEVISMNECRMHYKQGLDSEYLLCGRILQSTVSSSDNVCIGDDGGPLVFDGDVLIGILVAYDTECSNITDPQIYIRVKAYKHFIQRVAFGVPQPDTQSIILPILPHLPTIKR